MSTPATNLSIYLKTQADLNFYIQQQAFWSNKYEANSTKLSKQVKAEEKWNDAYDSAIDNERELNVNGVHVPKGNPSEVLAKDYADAKVDEYNEEMMLKLSDLDIEYDMMKTMYDTMIEQVTAQKESQKEVLSQAVQDTGLLS